MLAAFRFSNLKTFSIGSKVWENRIKPLQGLHAERSEKMEKSAELGTVFERLSSIMRQFEDELVVKAREADNYYLRRESETA